MHEIKVTINADHTVDVEPHEPLVSGTVDHFMLAPTFADEWDGLHRRVTYSCGPKAVTRDEDDPEWLTVPWETMVPGSMRLGFVGIGQDGSEVVRTSHMRRGIDVKAAAQDMGEEAREATMDVAERAKSRLDALSEAIPQVESMFQASQAQHQASFDQAQQHRAEQFTSRMGQWSDEVGAAVEDAGAAADNADDAADFARAAGQRADESAAAADAAAEKANKARGIKNLTQTQVSVESEGVNLWTAEMTDGSKSVFQVRNGKDGAGGKTPVRGVDYWTEADQAPINEATSAANTAASNANSAANHAEDVASSLSGEIAELRNDFYALGLYVDENGYICQKED